MNNFENPRKEPYWLKSTTISFRGPLQKKLYQKGRRLTKVSKSILDRLEKSREACSQQLLTKITDADRTSVHRTLYMLVNEQIIHKSILTEKFYPCTVEDDSVCHQTIICERCGKYDESPLYDHRHPKLPKFKIPRQIHEILALCSHCLMYVHKK